MKIIVLVLPRREEEMPQFVSNLVSELRHGSSDTNPFSVAIFKNPFKKEQEQIFEINGGSYVNVLPDVLDTLFTNLKACSDLQRANGNLQRTTTYEKKTVLAFIEDVVKLASNDDPKRLVVLVPDFFAVPLMRLLPGHPAYSGLLREKTSCFVPLSTLGELVERVGDFHLGPFSWCRYKMPLLPLDKQYNLASRAIYDTELRMMEMDPSSSAYATAVDTPQSTARRKLTIQESVKERATQSWGLFNNNQTNQPSDVDKLALETYMQYFITYEGLELIEGRAKLREYVSETLSPALQTFFTIEQMVGILSSIRYKLENFKPIVLLAMFLGDEARKYGLTNDGVVNTILNFLINHPSIIYFPRKQDIEQCISTFFLHGTDKNKPFQNQYRINSTYHEQAKEIISNLACNPSVIPCLQQLVVDQLPSSVSVSAVDPESDSPFNISRLFVAAATAAAAKFPVVPDLYQFVKDQFSYYFEYCRFRVKPEIAEKMMMLDFIEALSKYVTEICRGLQGQAMPSRTVLRQNIEKKLPMSLSRNFEEYGITTSQIAGIIGSFASENEGRPLLLKLEQYVHQCVRQRRIGVSDETFSLIIITLCSYPKIFEMSGRGLDEFIRLFEVLVTCPPFSSAVLGKVQEVIGKIFHDPFAISVLQQLIVSRVTAADFELNVAQPTAASSTSTSGLFASTHPTEPLSLRREIEQRVLRYFDDSPNIKMTGAELQTVVDRIEEFLHVSPGITNVTKAALKQLIERNKTLLPSQGDTKLSLDDLHNIISVLLRNPAVRACLESTENASAEVVEHKM